MEVLNHPKRGAQIADGFLDGMARLEPVRRHINWNNQRPDLKEDLAYATFQPEKQGKNLRQILSREFDHFMGGANGYLKNRQNGK